MAIAYGQITLTDLTDLGQFSVSPQSNSPLTQIYNPNGTASYTPDWSTNNVVITGLCYYGAQDVTSSSTLVWTRQDGSNTPSTLQTGETYNSTTKKLTISQNKLSDSNSKILTYYVTATYTEPESGTTLTAKGQITFNMQQVATSIKSARITGQNVFLYSSGSSTPTYNSITLQGTTENCSISAWQYKNSGGTFITKSAWGSGASIVVNANDSDIFISDVATIKLVTDDSNVFDIFSITKIRDGAAGTNNVVASLSNESQMIPFDSDGQPTEHAFDNAISTITIFDGSTDITSSYTITVTYGSVTGTYNASTHTVTITNMSSDTGYALFTCSKTGSPTIEKRFSLTKVTAGADGTSPTIYTLTPSTLVANKDIDNTLTPSSVTFSAYSQTGSTKTAYSGRFKIFINGSTTATYTSSSNESSHTYSFTSTDKTIVCKLYAAGGTTTELDSQTVIVASDGATGEQGPTGPGAYQVIMGNEVEMIPCSNSGNTLSSQTIEVPFTIYQGTSVIAPGAPTVTGAPTGITVSTSQTGKVVFTVANNSGLGGSDSGDIFITFKTSASVEVGTGVFHWYKSKQALNGVNSILFQVFSPNNTVLNGQGSATINTSLVDGGIEKTTGITYAWYKYSNGSYVSYTGTTSSITVPAADIDSFASFKCVATYGGISYTGYCTLYDKTDPIQIELFSSVGNILKNGAGVGAIYPMMTRNGSPYLPMKTYDGEIKISDTAPTGKANQYYYYIDATNSQIICKKWNGTSWVDDTDTINPDASITNGITYSYTFTNSSGQSTTYDAVTNRKCLYLDGDLFDTKIIVNFSVTE